MEQRFKAVGLLLLGGVLLMGALSWPVQGGDKRYPKLAPYNAIRWQGEKPEVRIKDVWYELRAIDGTKVAKIIAFAKQQYRRRWQKRFAEDMVQVLSEMGKAPAAKAKLELFDLKSKKTITLENVLWTRENRRAIMRFKKPDLDRNLSRPRQLSHSECKETLESFKEILESRWSYFKARELGLAKALAKIEKRTVLGMAEPALALELQRVIARSIDGHSSISEVRLEKVFHPFLIEPIGERFVAFKADRSGFLDPNFPFVTRIDGKDLSEWCRAAAAIVVRGSPQYVRRQSLRVLRHIQFVRREMGLKAKASLAVELCSRDGQKKKTLELLVTDQKPSYGQWPLSRSKLMKHKNRSIGYLRLESMRRRSSVPEIEEWLPKFKDSSGLIVDVRDNGGGSRAALRVLFSYLFKAGDAPRVVNCAAYRLYSGYEEDHLKARFMYRSDSAAWTDAERVTIKSFQKRFQPSWSLPKNEFSAWHYMVLSRLTDKDRFCYARPVIILMNAKCFSATDVFLSALKGWRNVTLLGAASGGGSAFAHRVGIKPSRILVRLGSMASFQANGSLFDGQGVQPDIELEPVPEFFIGGRDVVLEKALELLEKS